MREIFISGKRIADDEECFVIAEIGHNHMGDVEICKQLFLEAKKCGCDAVKLQKRNNRAIFTKALYNSPYDNIHSYGPTYGEHREALEFNFLQYQELKRYCDEIGILFFATAFDEESAGFLLALDVPAFKIASGDLTNTPLIKYIAQLKKPMIISTGGGTFSDIDRALMYTYGAPVAFLYCVASYPNKPQELDLNVIDAMRERYQNTAIGYSCHYNGILMAEAAYLHGARIIEKHFTLNHTWRGTDHALSLEPQGMESMVHNIRRLKQAHGSGNKMVLQSELAPLRKMAKSVHVARPVSVGSVIQREDVCIKSPGDGIPPYMLDEVIGKIAVCSLTTSDELTWEKVK